MNFKKPPYNVLLIEPNNSISSVKNILEGRNHSVTTLNNGKEALQYIKSIDNNTFDLILLDLILPEISGWDILNTLRSQPNSEHYPVIILTEVDDDTSEIQALFNGADDYIVKPCNIKLLLARMEAGMRKRLSQNAMKIELPFATGTYKKLTERETEILRYIVQGYTNNEIAKLSYITELTAANHIKKIFRKLNVNNRIQAAVLALKYNLVN